MLRFPEFPIHVRLAGLLWFLAVGALWYGLRRLATGLSAVDHPASALRQIALLDRALRAATATAERRVQA